MCDCIGFPKKSTEKFSKKEVKLIFDVLLVNGPIIPSNEETIFKLMTKALGGRRDIEKVKLWYFNIKRILEHEKRFTVAVKQSLGAEEQEKLKELMLWKEELLNDLGRKRKVEEDDSDYEVLPKNEEEGNEENNPNLRLKMLRLSSQ